MSLHNKSIYINGRFLSQRMTGVQRFAAELVNALDQHLQSDETGINCVLLVPHNAFEIPQYKKIEVRVVGCRTGHAWEQFELPRHCSDGLLVNLGNTAPLLVNKQIVVIHDMGVYAVPETYSLAFRLWYRFMFWVLSKRQNVIATVSRFSRQEIHRILNIALEQIPVLIVGREHILRVAADEGVFAKHGIGQRPYILAVSSMTANKNFSIVVKAIELMGKTDFDFVIAGGANPAVFAGSISGLPASVKHVGYVSDAELKALYQRAVCLVFPSLYEGFGSPPMEAMTCGCPVVVSSRASIPEVCGNAGLYFDPQDAFDVKEKIMCVMGDARLQTDLRERGLLQVQPYSWHQTAEQLLQIASTL